MDGIERCIDDEIPFEIPEGWEWVRLHSLVSKEIKRGKSPKYSTQKGIQVFAQKCNVKTGGIDMTLAKYLDPSTFAKYPQEEYLQDYDIIINSTGNGTLGRIGIFQDADRIDDSIIVPDSHVTTVRMLPGLNKGYLLYVLKYYQPYLEKQGTGSTNQTELRPSIIGELLIPVSSEAEQYRIVRKIDTALSILKGL
ncbi:MAG: restriction endonuclease subunit S [Lachnospiraceae bacterium]|nr:restriction endonuclease subunit S [Lachnospiraceae bacterium]